MISDIDADPNGDSNSTSPGLHRPSHWWIVGIVSITVTLTIGGLAFAVLPDLKHRGTLKRMERWFQTKPGTPTSEVLQPLQHLGRIPHDFRSIGSIEFQWLDRQPSRQRPL